MYSSIKIKKCKCSPDCKFYPNVGYDGYYYKHAPVGVKERQDTKTKRQRSDANKRKLQKVNNLRTPESDEAVKRQIWFSERRAEMSGYCSCGCSERSSKDEDKYFKFSICHILPQRHFKSVQWHRLNWIEMNFWLGHHTNFDNQGSEGWDKLACWPEIVRRFKILYPLTYTYERQFIPKILQQLIPDVLRIYIP